MITDLFIITYQKDAAWFRQSLKVIHRNLTGYRNIHVVLQDWKGKPPVDNGAPEAERVIWHKVQGWPGQGYHHQQYCKLLADQYSDADLILHFDSDTFLKSATTVDAFMVDGKPAWLWAWYTDLGDTVPWQAPTEKATGMKCPMEFMQATPFLIHRSTYALARKVVEDANGDLRTYMQGCAKAGNQSFSEFNVIGSVAFAQERDKYHWVDRNRDPWPPGYDASRQFWSHAPLKDHEAEIRAMLGEPMPERAIRCTDMGIWILSNDTHISQWVEKHRRLDFDGHLLPKILKLIDPGDVVVDVGAFIGDHTWAYAKKVIGDGEGSVLAFEPNPLPFECLKRNMVGHGHVQCINKGLGAFPGTMAISPSPNVGASHLVAGTGVEITTLDSYALTRCDLIKIDAEGHEFFILQGAWQTITKLRPVLVLEINIGALERVGVMVEDIYGWLKLRGYAVTGHMKGEPQFDVICLPR